MNPWRIGIMAGVAAAACVLGGCGGDARGGPYQAQAGQRRDIQQAEELYQQAVALLTDDPQRAKGLLQEALGKDLYHGAAHNNLGVLLLEEGRLYDAAEEFEWARKLLPGHPEPRVNLAIALQRGGKHREAIDAARTALEVRPGHLLALQTLAWVQVREGLEDQQTVGCLDAIIERSEDPTWKDWAARQRLRLESAAAAP